MAGNAITHLNTVALLWFKSEGLIGGSNPVSSACGDSEIVTYFVNCRPREMAIFQLYVMENIHEFFLFSLVLCQDIIEFA